MSKPTLQPGLQYSRPNPRSTSAPEPLVLTPTAILRKYEDPALRPRRGDKPTDLDQWPVSRFTGKIISLAQQEDEERWFQQQQEKGQTHSAYHSLSQVRERQQEAQPKEPKVDRRRRRRPKLAQTPPTESEVPRQQEQPQEHQLHSIWHSFPSPCSSEAERPPVPPKEVESGLRESQRMSWQQSLDCVMSGINWHHLDGPFQPKH